MNTLEEIVQHSGLQILDKKADLWLEESNDKRAVIQFKQKLRGVRDLHALLLSLAVKAVKEPEVSFFLILVDPGLSPSRLENELLDALSTFTEEVRSRLTVLSFEEGGLAFASTENRDKLPYHLLEQVIERLSVEKSVTPMIHRPDYFFVILKILLNRLLLRQGPISTSLLMEQAGCSYPTVAKKLQRLAPFLTRHSNRQMELTRFPKQPWAELLIVSKRVRQTIEYVDRSGKPRTPDTLLRRLYQRPPSHVAVGGVYGASHWDNELDLQGAPRLDLSLHSPGYDPDLSFLEKLDPALKPVENSQEPVNLAVHIVSRVEPLFEFGAGLAVPWADPVECLLDLHEMRLVQQAHEFLEYFLREGK